MSNPLRIDGFVSTGNSRFDGTPGIRVRTIVVGDAKWRSSDVPAVLFISPDGSPVKVYSEDQVKAMLREILMVQTMDAAGITTVDTEHIEGVAKIFGIDLP